MNDARSKIASGIFVTAGFLILAASILFFGGDRAFLKNYNRYKIAFDSTQGLTNGSVISVSGVEVGHVERIDFSDEHKLVATITVEDKFAQLIGKKSIASVKTQGALGDKYIYITAREIDDVPLQNGDFVMADTSGDIIDVITNKFSDLSQITDTVKELNILLNNLNANGKSAHITENILQATQNVSQLASDQNIRESLMTLQKILTKIDKGHGTLGRLINDPAIYDKLVGLLGDSPRNQYLKPLLRETIKQSEQSR